MGDLSEQLTTMNNQSNQVEGSSWECDQLNANFAKWVIN